MVKALGITNVSAFTDSKLVAKHFEGSSEARDEKMIQYMKKLKEEGEGMELFTLSQISHSENSKADALSKFSSSSEIYMER